MCHFRLKQIKLEIKNFGWFYNFLFSAIYVTSAFAPLAHKGSSKAIKTISLKSFRNLYLGLPH